MASVAALMMAGGLATGITQAAGAAPQPTISQVQARVKALTARYDKAVEQYDQVAGQLTAARARLAQVSRELAGDQAKYDGARAKVAQIASASYEGSGQTSLAGLLTSSDPAAVLRAGALLTELAGARNAQARALLSAAQQLSSARAAQQRAEYGISQLLAQRASARNSIKKLLDAEQATLDSLTAQQRAAVQAGSLGGGAAGTTHATYTGPAGTQAGKAVAFAYAQLGKPYQWGATGPGSYDCSGLVQAAWAAAGVSIPRTTYEQWSALPHVSLSQLQPGDLIFYDGIGHVSMYVGGGYIIDAPRTGETVRKLPESTGWYAQTVNGAARP